jgi:hypothetical protein
VRELELDEELMTTGLESTDGAEPNQQFKRIKTKLSDVENKIPDLIDSAELERKFTVSYHDSIAIMITREVKRYNGLILYIGQQIASIQGGLDGEHFLDPELEEVYQAIMQDRTPSIWILNAYPGSHHLPDFMANLQVRVAYLAELVESKQPNKRQFIFWLPGFLDQANVFNMILQHEARR